MMGSSAQKWAVAMVLFHPPMALQTRLDYLQQAGIKTYLWFNSTVPQTLAATDIVPMNVEGYKNLGLGKALQGLLTQARSDGFDKLLYFDQDTQFSPDSLQCIDDFLKKGHYPDDYAAIRFKEAKSELPGTEQLEQTALLLSSGTLFNVKANAQHSERFFVEGVDYQYCLDAAAKGWKLAEMPCMGIEHDSQQPRWQFSVGSYVLNYRPYPIRRHFAFLGALVRLFFLACLALQVQYAWLFARNFCTHLATQLQMLVLAMLFRMRLAKKAVYL